MRDPQDPHSTTRTSPQSGQWRPSPTVPRGRKKSSSPTKYGKFEGQSALGQSFSAPGTVAAATGAAGCSAGSCTPRISAIFSSVERDSAAMRPPSIMLTADCMQPAWAASATCVSPARRRASRNWRCRGWRVERLLCMDGAPAVTRDGLQVCPPRLSMTRRSYQQAIKSC